MKFGEDCMGCWEEWVGFLNTTQNWCDVGVYVVKVIWALRGGGVGMCVHAVSLVEYLVEFIYFGILSFFGIPFSSWWWNIFFLSYYRDNSAYWEDLTYWDVPPCWDTISSFIWCSPCFGVSSCREVSSTEFYSSIIFGSLTSFSSS